MTNNIKCRKVACAEILGLRADELRSGMPPESARFPEDELPGTLHFGGYIRDELVCCLTLIEHKDTIIPTWQLRGMATRKNMQRKGAGRTLLQFAEWYLRNRKTKLCIWCNARINAVPFYKNMGYRVISGSFDIPDIGIHYKMEKTFM